MFSEFEEITAIVVGHEYNVNRLEFPSDKESLTIGEAGIVKLNVSGLRMSVDLHHLTSAIWDLNNGTKSIDELSVIPNSSLAGVEAIFDATKFADDTYIGRLIDNPIAYNLSQKNTWVVEMDYIEPKLSIIK